MRRRSVVAALLGAGAVAWRGAAARTAGGTAELRPEGVSRAALETADRRAAAAGRTLRLPAGRYVVEALRLVAPAVAFDAGARIVAAASDARVTILGRVSGPRLRLFEAPDGDAPMVSLGRQPVFPEWWGATGEGDPGHGADDSMAWQQAIDSLACAGGSVLARAGASYPLRYPIVVTGSDIAIDLAGARLLTDLARKDRAAAPLVLIGDSREWNLATIRRRRAAGDLFNAFENPAHVDIGMLPASGGRTNVAAGRFPDPADPGTAGFTARRCAIRSGSIAFTDDVVAPGNYGVQFANAADCGADGLVMRNTGQGFGFGSDVAPRVPYAVGCRVRDIRVERVNQAHTYYGAGFHGYARDCHDERVTVLAGAPEGTPDGNLWATSFALGCSSTGSGGICGRGANGEGFAIGAGSRRCVVRGATVARARRAFVNFGPLDIAPADASSFIDCQASDVDYLIALESRNARFVGVSGRGVRIAELLADNANATGNLLARCDIGRVQAGAVGLAQVRARNRLLP